MDVIKKVASSVYGLFGMVMGEHLYEPNDRYLSVSPYLRTYFG